MLVPEGRGIFAPMTVAENLELGAYLLNDAAEFERRQARVFGLFPRMRVAERRSRKRGEQAERPGVARWTRRHHL